jgi:WD40 repeat protein
MRASEVSRVLLLVDQFEELFRFANLRSDSNLDPHTAAERRDEATLFVRLLLTATKSLQMPIHVVVTMRSDFIGDCARFHGLPEAVSRSQFLVPGMTRDQREDVIRKPVQLAGGQIDPGLVQRALNDTSDDPDQLPILQHVMMRCWDRAHNHCKREADERPYLAIEDYETVGGVERALSLHANEILAELAERPDSTNLGLQLATKRAFQALTETDQEGRSIRNPQRFFHLVQYVSIRDAGEADTVAQKATRVIVRRFANPDCSFLRVIPPTEGDHFVDDIDNDSIVDIGHEALIRRWDRLQAPGEENWMREEQEDAEHYKDLLRYEARGAIIPPEDLPALERWWSSRIPNAFWAGRHTRLSAGKVEDRFKEVEGKFKKVREVLIRSRARADAAIEESRKYECRVLAIVADAIRVPRVFSGAADSLALALNKPLDLPTVKEYLDLLYKGLGDLRETRRIRTRGDFEKQVFALSFSPGGKLLAAVVPGNLLFYDSETGALVHSVKTKGGWALSLRWSPDGQRIYVGTSPVAQIIHACSIEKLRKYFTGCSDDEWNSSVDVGSEENPAGFGVWSHDSKWILVAGWQRRASLWDASKGQFKRVLHDDRLEGSALDYLSTDLAASADGERIALGAVSGRIHIFSARSTGQDGPSLKLESSLDSIDKNTNPLPYSLVFDAQNHDRLLAAYMPTPHMALWKVDQNAFSIFGDEQSGTVWRVALDPEGEFLASATNDATVRLWMINDSDSAVHLRGHLNSVFAVDISPENRTVASASFDGTIRLWTRKSPLSPTLLSNSISIPSIHYEFSAEDAQISVTGNDGRKYSATLPQGFGEPSAAAVSSNGAGIAVVPKAGHPVLFVNFSDHLMSVSVTLCDVKSEWTAVTFIENDTRIAARTKEGKIFTWPFYSDVHLLEQLAREHLPLVRDDNGVDKRLEISASILRK